MTFNKTCGRLQVEVTRDGYINPDYGYGASIKCHDGWNDACKILTLTMSLDEFRDLHYLIGRALDGQRQNLGATS